MTQRELDDVGAHIRTTRVSAGLTQADLTRLGPSTAQVDAVEYGLEVDKDRYVSVFLAVETAVSDRMLRGDTAVDHRLLHGGCCGELALRRALDELIDNDLGPASRRRRHVHIEIAYQHQASVEAVVWGGPLTSDQRWATLPTYRNYHVSPAVGHADQLWLAATPPTRFQGRMPTVLLIPDSLRGSGRDVYRALRDEGTPSTEALQVATTFND